MILDQPAFITGPQDMLAPLNYGLANNLAPNCVTTFGASFLALALTDNAYLSSQD